MLQALVTTEPNQNRIIEVWNISAIQGWYLLGIRQWLAWNHHLKFLAKFLPKLAAHQQKIQERRVERRGHRSYLKHCGYLNIICWWVQTTLFVSECRLDCYWQYVRRLLCPRPSFSQSLKPPHPRTREQVVCQKYDSSKSDYIPNTAPIAEQNFVQKAEAALYADAHWVSIGGQLYRFVGTHYELQSEAEEKRRIGDWLNTYSENVKGRYVYNRAKSSNVAEIINWVVSRTAIDPNKVNPDGLNCSNGVVRINPNGTHILMPHSPKQVYTYVGGKYDPAADPTDCDRLLECLDESRPEIFLRTAAAGLNLRLVRSKLTGRGVKGLLCYGEGSNGKDTLRAVLAAVFGRGMTGKSLSDFKAYDGGRKFALATIEGGVCNWASENASNVSLDALQSLKQFITGDPIDIERKGKDSYEYKPTAIFLANCNKLPSITGGTAAIDDRYGILSFKKTYKRGAVASQGELEADPRFKDDPDFILERIAPAMLNKMLERMPLLLAEGIDYNATREAMREAQEESRHLWQFARDVGLEVQSNGRVYIKDLWQELQEWYHETGTLELEYNGNGKEKLVWHDRKTSPPGPGLPTRGKVGSGFNRLQYFLRYF